MLTSQAFIQKHKYRLQNSKQLDNLAQLLDDYHQYKLGNDVKSVTTEEPTFDASKCVWVVDYINIFDEPAQKQYSAKIDAYMFIERMKNQE